MYILNPERNIDVNINYIYGDASIVLEKFIDNNPNFIFFSEISKDIIYLIHKTQIKYNNLSINGLLPIHSVNVAILSGLIGISYNVPDVESLVTGSLLHDIGKYYISNDILNKKSTLSVIERLAIDEHTKIGHKIISLFTSDSIILNIVLNHHSSVRRSQEKISLQTFINENNTMLYPTICGIVDIIDAMLSFRPYKKPLSIEEVKRDLEDRNIDDIETIFNILF